MIGKTTSGKTTLTQRLLEKDLVFQKTQSVELNVNFIDTPGEYLENRHYYNALISTSADADIIGFVEDCTATSYYFPPSFTAAFGKECIGIITKIDLAKSKDDILKARERLEISGVSKIFELSCFDGRGIENLKDELKKEV